MNNSTENILVKKIFDFIADQGVTHGEAQKACIELASALCAMDKVDPDEAFDCAVDYLLKAKKSLKNKPKLMWR